MSLRTLRGGLLALLLPMTACVSGPDYHLPANAVAATPRAARAFVSGGEASFSHDAPPDRWWELYGDPSLTATCAKHWRPTPTYALPMPTSGAPALPCWSTARAVPYRPTWMRRARSSMPVATPASAAPQSYALGLHLLSTGSCRRYPPRHRSRERGRRGRRCGAGPGPRGRRCGRHPGLSPVCTRNHTLAATRQVLAVQRATLEATRRPAAGGRGTDFDVSRAGAAVNRSAAGIPHLLAERRPHCSNWPH